MLKQQIAAIVAEVQKNRHAKITWVTFIAFSLAPLFGGVFMILMLENGLDGLSGAFRAKAALMSFSANWDSYLGLLSQAVGVGGVLIFGFVASWLFGREYSDDTAKDLLALPISRTKIVNAKFFYYGVWCLALVVSNLLLGLLIGFLVKIPGWTTLILLENLRIYFITTGLIIFLNTPVAFLAISGKGYLVPLGVVALTLVLAQIIGALGLGRYFPWSVPAIFSGSGGVDMRSSLNFFSYLIVFFTGWAGYFATIFWWKYADQGK